MGWNRGLIGNFRNEDGADWRRHFHNCRRRNSIQGALALIVEPFGTGGLSQCEVVRQAGGERVGRGGRGCQSAASAAAFSCALDWVTNPRSMATPISRVTGRTEIANVNATAADRSRRQRRRACAAVLGSDPDGAFIKTPDIGMCLWWN